MKNNKKEILKDIIIFIVLLISVVIVLAAIFYKNNFAEQSFEALLYSATRGVENANTEIVSIGIKKNIFNIILLLSILYFPMVKKFDDKYIIDIKFGKRKKSINLFPFNRKLFTVTILILSLIFAASKIGLFEYIKAQLSRSSIFEKEYVSADSVDIEFPEEKRNLIYIFLESAETGLMSKEEGGAWEYNLIPELTKLAKENINFSNTEKIGGALQLAEASWTTSGMLAQTAGVPLKLSISPNDYSGYDSFLPGVYTLGDILKKEGYNLELMIGSDASFGGRRDYFASHGDYEIFDYNTAIEENKMTEEDKVWWGFSDDDLFEWAKTEILDLARQDKPFNFIMLTVDTHFVDGYLSEKAEKIYDRQYENVFAYSSKCTYDFVKWIQSQEFYENTTVVLVGDHLGMQTEFYQNGISDKNYVRTVYNVFINSAIEDVDSKNRQFTTLDIFPTVLASMGVKIEGDRLGLGTNLFSSRQTIVEEMGFDEFKEELSKRSNYYIKNLLQDDYKDLLTAIPVEEGN